MFVPDLEVLYYVCPIDCPIGRSQKFGPQLSKPKRNHQLNSTKFEVGLHSYPDIHHPTPPGTLYVVVVVNCPATAPASQAGRLYNYTVRVQCRGTLYVVVVVNCLASRDLCVQVYSHKPVQTLCTQ